MPDDEQLIEAAKSDPEAFGRIFDCYYPIILAYVTRRVSDVALAEDITAEVFISALRALPRFTWQGVPISAWLYKIATNHLRMYYRKKKYTSSLEELQEAHGFEPIDERDFVEEIVEAQASLERHKLYIEATRLIASLPLKYQEVLTLRFVEQKKIREIALIVNKKESTVKSLLMRGLALLRRRIQSNATFMSERRYKQVKVTNKP